MTLITNYLNVENNNCFMCDGIDPDSNIQNRICVDSLYYTEGSSILYLVHFNCRSMASNFDKVKDSVKD